jgi:hypothetical protein
MGAGATFCGHGLAMKPLTYIIGLGIIAMLISVSTLAFGAHAARMKGLSAISQELSSRIATPDMPIDLTDFMPGEGLETLAGSWLPQGAEHSFQNGEPNAVNMVLIRLTFFRFAQNLAKSCESAQFPLNDNFYDTLEALCAWPSAEARNDKIMQDFWLSLMGYNAVESEYVAWRDFILRDFGGKSARESIEAMTLSLMLNPYFLLQH